MADPTSSNLMRIFQEAQAAGLQAASASSTSGRASLFRRALGAGGVAGLRQATGFNLDDDDETSALATLARNGRLSSLAGSGLSAERWTRNPSEWGGEEFGFGARQSTAAGSTGAVITVDVTLEIDLTDAVLLLHDPTGHIVGNGGYWSSVTKGKREMILGAGSTEWKPCDADDLSVLVGEGQSEKGGIYLGNLKEDDDVSVSVYIPTSTTDVVWGLVVRGQPVKSDQGYQVLQGTNINRSRFFRGA